MRRSCLTTHLFVFAVFASNQSFCDHASSLQSSVIRTKVLNSMLVVCWSLCSSVSAVFLASSLCNLQGYSLKYATKLTRLESKSWPKPSSGPTTSQSDALASHTCFHNVWLPSHIFYLRIIRSQTLLCKYSPNYSHVGEFAQASLRKLNEPHYTTQSRRKTIISFCIRQLLAKYASNSYSPGLRVLSQVTSVCQKSW